MSTLGAMSGTLATIFSLEKSRKWIIREGLKGISRTGSGASMARGLKKSRGLRKWLSWVGSGYVATIACKEVSTMRRPLTTLTLALTCGLVLLGAAVAIAIEARSGAGSGAPKAAADGAVASDAGVLAARRTLAAEDVGGARRPRACGGQLPARCPRAADLDRLAAGARWRRRSVTTTWRPARRGCRAPGSRRALVLLVNGPRRCSTRCSCTCS